METDTQIPVLQAAIRHAWHAVLPPSSQQIVDVIDDETAGIVRGFSGRFWNEINVLSPDISEETALNPHLGLAAQWRHYFLPAWLLSLLRLLRPDGKPVFAGTPLMHCIQFMTDDRWRDGATSSELSLYTRLQRTCIVGFLELLHEHGHHLMIDQWDRDVRIGNAILMWRTM